MRMGIRRPTLSRPTARRHALGAALAAAALGMAALTGSVVAPAVAAPGTSQLVEGEGLVPGETLVSDSGQYVVEFDEYGGLFESGAVDGLWYCCGTELPAGDVRLAVQTDGNVVIYSSTFGVLLNTQTNGATDVKLVLQDDGNLVVYNGAGQPLWWNGVTDDQLVSVDQPGGSSVLESGWYLSAPDRRTKLVMQTDGNLVLYGPGSRALWWTGTNGSGAERLALQEDGNLVLYRANGTPAWQSGTRGVDLNILAVQDDGNLVLYSGYDDGIGPVWWTGTRA
jgi:hypothetical protein